MMKFKLKLLFLFLFALLASGCWDRIELNDLSIVTGIAVDKGEEFKYKMTVEALNATENSKMQAQGFAPSITYSQEGNSLAELANRMNVGMSRKLIYSHTRVFVIEKEIAKEGLLGFIDYLERSGEFRNDFNLIVFEGEEAAQALKVTYPLQKVSSLKVNKQIDMFYKDWGGDPNVRLTDFISSLISPGKEPALATIRVKGNPEAGETIKNIQRVDPKALIEITGLAVFKGDKLVGTLPIKDTRNYLWIKGLDSTSLTIPCEEEGKFVDIRIRRSRTEIDSKIENGVPHFNVHIHGEAKIEGSQCTADLEKIKTYRQYEKRTEELIKAEVSETIKIVQEKYESDIFGFGEVLERQHYEEFKKRKKEWNRYFSEAIIDVEAIIHLRRSGVRNKSFQTEIESQNKGD
jgi:spore germination protein KC